MGFHDLQLIKHRRAATAPFTQETVMKICLASVVGVLVLGTSVHAQPQIGSYTPPVTNPRPIISPYLNLNRGGVAPAIDYFGIVRPQIDNQKAIQQLQQQYQTTQGQLGQLGQQLGTDEMAPTGRTTMGGYFNYSHYFPLYNRGAGATGGTGIRR
jgi:hypothetical protein